MKRETEIELRSLAKDILQEVPEGMSLEIARGIYMYLAEQRIHAETMERIIPLLTAPEGAPGDIEYKWDIQKQ